MKKVKNTGHSTSKSQYNQTHQNHQNSNRFTYVQNDLGQKEKKNSTKSNTNKTKSTLTSTQTRTLGQKNTQSQKEKTPSPNSRLESSSSSSIDSIGKQLKSNDKVKHIESKIKRMEIGGATGDLNNSASIQRIDDEDENNQVDTSFDHPPSKKLLTSPNVYSSNLNDTKTDVNMVVTTNTTNNNGIDTSLSTNPTDDSQTVNMSDQNGDQHDVNKIDDQANNNDVSMNNSNGNPDDPEDGK